MAFSRMKAWNQTASSTLVHLQVAALKAEWARQEDETKAEEQRRHMRMQQLRHECEEFNRCSVLEIPQTNASVTAKSILHHLQNGLV